MENEGREQMAILPALAMRGIVMFPSMTLHFDVGRETVGSRHPGSNVPGQADFPGGTERFYCRKPEAEDIYTVGVVARIVQLLNNGKDSIRIMVEGLYKAEAISYDLSGEFYTAQIRRLYDHDELDASEDKQEGMMRALVHSFDDYARWFPKCRMRL